MVFIVDEGSSFPVSLDGVWKLIEAHDTDAQKIHPDNKNMSGEAAGESYVVSWESEMQGRTVKVKNKFTPFAPVGMAIEVLEGPMAGSKFFNYYSPRGAQTTAVTVVGHFSSPMVPESQLEQVVRGYLDKVFNEDLAYVRQMKLEKPLVV